MLSHMKKIILSSHGFQKNAKLKERLLVLLSQPAEQLSAVIVTTASAEWKEKNKHAVLAKEALESMRFKRVDFLDIEFEDPKNLKEFDVIYINGGNPFYLLYHLKKSGADQTLKECVEQSIIIGVSGGGVVFGPNIKVVDYFDAKLNTVELNDLTGLGLVDAIIYPHYQDDVEEKIRQFEIEENCQIARLRDNQALLVVGDKVESF